MNVGLDLEAGGEVMIAVTVDADDPDKVLSLSATGTAAANGGTKAPPGMSEQEWRAKGGKALTASVDLNSTETKTMAYDFMAAAGIPTPSSSGSSPRENFGKATNTFFGAVQDRGVLTVQDVERDTSTYGAEASAKHGIGVGLGVQYTDQEVKMSNGYYYDIETGEWKKWEGC